MALAEGQTIGNYRVLKRIGSGGMGAVYLAEHVAIGKRVAIKVIHRDLSTSREVLGRFYQEARAVATIGNEHIVDVHDYGQSPEGDHFFVMDMVDGVTLASVMERERVLDLGRAMHIAAQIADGLGAAHAVGIIHRDLKPDNVMLTRKGGNPDFVKLLDFGLAKVMAEHGMKGLTKAGVILGTPQYMSPEACESKKVDHRTDIYALGVLLFQMCTGRVPFDGDSMGAVLIKQVTEAPPAPRSISAAIPPALEQVILRALAKSPAARFQTMQEVIDALVDPQRYLASSPPLMPASSPGAKGGGKTMIAVAPPPQAHAPRVSAAHGAAAGPMPGPPTAMPAVAPATGAYGAPAGGEAFASAATAAVSTSAAAAPMPVPMSAPVVAPVPRPGALPVPQNQTMMIATPPGFKSHPPRKGAPWLIAGGAIAVVAAIVVAVLVMSGGATKADEGGGSGTGSAVATGSGTGSGTGTGTGTASGSASGSGSGSGSDSDSGSGSGSGSGSDPGTGTGTGSGTGTGAESAGSGSGSSVPARLARITVTTEPEGAEVYDELGRKLGVTPTELGFPADGSEHELTFRHPKRKERKKTIAATGDMAVTVVLERR